MIPGGAKVWKTKAPPDHKHYTCVWKTLHTGLAKRYSEAHCRTRLEDGILITGGAEVWKTEAPPDHRHRPGVWKTLHTGRAKRHSEDSQNNPSGRRYLDNRKHPVNHVW